MRDLEQNHVLPNLNLIGEVELPGVRREEVEPSRQTLQREKKKLIIISVVQLLMTVNNTSKKTRTNIQVLELWYGLDLGLTFKAVSNSLTK